MKLWQQAKLLFKIKAVVDAVEKEKSMGYDFKVGAAKAIRDFVITCGAVGGAAVLSYFTVPEHIAAVIGFLPETVQHALIPLLSSAFVFGLNWLKERDK